MSNYIQDCLNFMGEERKAYKKELWRLLRLDDKGHNDEGQTINNAKAVRYTKEQNTVFSFPAQFTKLREEKKVELYNSDKNKIDDAEVVSVDYLKNEIILDCNFPIGQTVLIVLSLEVAPYAIMGSLQKITQEGPSTLSHNLMSRVPNITTYGEPTIKNMCKTANEMNNSWAILVGPPGTGKTFSAKGIIEHLLKNKKSIAVTSNSHSAINNLLQAIEYKKFSGAKICSRSHHGIKHDQIKNISVQGKNIDSQVSGYDLVGGTAFALSRVHDVRFDYLIVDEASQLKMSFLLAVSRIAHNVIVLGDPAQLQSISIVDDTKYKGGESVLNYLMGNKKIVTADQGYFLNTTYRMEPRIAKVISEVFYEGKLGWSQKVEKQGITLVTSNHTTGQKMSEHEAKDVLKIYKSLLKKKVKSEDIMIIAPYNAQCALIRTLITNDKVCIMTADLAQGQENKILILSMVSAGNKENSAAFSTNANRLNVAISRAKEGCFIVASEGLQNSKYTSPEFKKILKMIS